MLSLPASAYGISVTNSEKKKTDRHAAPHGAWGGSRSGEGARGGKDRDAGGGREREKEREKERNRKEDSSNATGETVYIYIYIYR